MKYPSSQTAVGAIVLGALVGGAILLSVVNDENTNRVHESFGWVTHTLEVEGVFRETLRGVTTAESTQRGYLVTSDVAYLERFTPAVDSVGRFLTTLRRLTADNPSQQRRLDTLQRLVAAKLDELRSTVDLARSGHRAAALLVVETSRGRLLMDSIIAVGRQAVEAENFLLAARQATLDRALRRDRTLEIWIVVFTLAALTLAGFFWRRLRYAQGLVTVCSWSKTILYEGEWMSFEAYMSRRFGLSISHGMSPAEAAKMTAEMEALDNVSQA